MAEYKGSYDECTNYNRLTNLDSLEWKIISHLLYSQTKNAQNIWKILKYPTMDCLLQDNVSLEDRYALIDTEDGKETNKRMFLSPYVDDAWTEQCAHVHIYTDGIFPQNHEVATVNVAIETISHSKIIKVLGDADGRDINPLLPPPNPNDSNKQGEPVVLYKNRETVLLKSMIAELNGLYLDGVGYFQFNQKTNSYNNSQQKLWNGRTYIGHITKMAMLVSGVSEGPNYNF